MTETAEAEPSGDADVVILIPLYNDWASLRLLLVDLDGVLAHASLRARVLVVDDGSTAGPEGGGWGPYTTLGPIEVVHLRRNLGHQRAIAVGLPYIADHIPCRAVVLMDSDGEDAPSDVPRLLARFEEEGGRKIVFAERARRSESPTFIVFYILYKWAHVALTGIGVRVGNFSVIPRRRLESLAVVSELWSHYAAAVFKSRQPFCSVPTHRATRLAGKPQMNFVRLVVHGLSAISVFSDIIGVRLLVATMVLTLLCLGGIGATIGRPDLHHAGDPRLGDDAHRHLAHRPAPGDHVLDPLQLPHPRRPPGDHLPAPPRLLSLRRRHHHPRPGTMTDYTYVGAELDLFAAATNWKSYLRRQLAPYIGRDGPRGRRRLRRDDADALRRRPRRLDLPRARRGPGRASGRVAPPRATCRRAAGSRSARSPTCRSGSEYDTLLYIDVLEHIEDDAAEMARAAEHVKPGGHVVVLSPAHQWLYTPFDKAIGHFRRYTKRSLRAAAPPGLEQVRMGYLDSVGMLASLGNRLFLNRSMPKPGQIAVWDKLMVPVSLVLDPLLAHSTGRSILGIWRRPPARTAP